MRSHDTCDAIIPLRKGGKGGCKLVLMKMGNNPGKTQPPMSPFVKGDLGVVPPLLRGTNFEHESGKHT